MIALQSSIMTLVMLIVELAATLSVLSHHVESVTDSVRLNTGALMPLLARYDHDTDINQQLENKYRHFVVNSNGTILGNVMHEWVFNGRLNYESIFITVMPDLLKPEHVSKCLDKLLEQLQVPYVDLYLLRHSRDHNFLQMWKEMENQVRAGKAKAIGVVVYERGETIDRIIKSSTILPAVVSIHVVRYLSDKSFADYFANLGIATMVDSISLRRPMTEKIRDIAKRRNVSADEIYLRYFTQRNITVLTNMDVGFLKAFEFNLSKENIDTIKSIRPLDVHVI